MDPKTVRFVQALPCAVITPLLASLFNTNAALAISVMLVVCVSIWAALVRFHRNRTVGELTAWRRSRDRVMRENATLAFAPGLVAGAVHALVGWGGIVDPAYAGVVLAGPLLLIVGSSGVDWYVITPFRDGAHGAPACRKSVSILRRRRYTTAQISHRLICESGVGVGVVLGAVALALHYVPDATKTINDVLALLGGVAVLVAALYRRWIAGALRFCLNQSPGFGSVVEGDNDRGKTVRGRVLEVSIGDGVKVATEPGGRERFIPLRNAVPDITLPDSEQTEACLPNGLCRRWFRVGGEVTCEAALREDEA